VLILSKEFVRKKHCMAELRMLLQRCKEAAAAPEDPSTQAEQESGSAAAPQVQLLPVLYHLTVEQLRGMRQLYDSEPWCVEEHKPPAHVLDQWAQDLQEVVTHTMMCHPQVRPLSV
jgi:hypothetical protein